MENKKDSNIIDIDISQEMKRSFIDYAMSVIVARAIPDVRDGLKPVHRRILYAMYGLDMTYTHGFKKSARAVGEVIAKYHPHGDSSVYDALVRLAQPFSMRYPLILGQGNFGSIDGDSAAAMRYTEAKLQKITNWMLDDIKKETVPFQVNYDGSEIEPMVLPSKLPNLLINGTTGIAVGMATSIPPHNLIETIKAAKYLLKNPDADIEKLMHFLPGPDFPTGGMIINKKELSEIYQRGSGRVILRSKAHFEKREEKNPLIIVTEIPYVTKKEDLILKIVALIKSKAIDSIADIRDESNREGIRVVIKLKKGFDPEVELNRLFKQTPLQTSFSVNMLALVYGAPKILNLKQMLNHYLHYQNTLLLNKTKFELQKAESRKHILLALQIALKSIDEIVQILKKANTPLEAMNKLIERFSFDEKQARAILEMKLQRLTHLEQDTLDTEINLLLEKVKNFEDILASKDRQNREISKMLNQIQELFGDERKTMISEKDHDNITNEDLIPKKEVLVTITAKGYVKRMNIENYQPQKRGGLGSKTAKITENDYTDDILIASTHSDLLLFSSLGKVYRLRVYEIPERSKISKGVPINNLISIQENEKINSVFSIQDYDNSSLFFISKKGVVKKTDAILFERINRNGKRAITLRENDNLLGVLKIPKKHDVDIFLGTSNGKAIHFLSDEVRSMGRTAAGVRGIRLIDNAEVVDYTFAYPTSLIWSLSSKGFGKLTNVSEYRLTKRGGVGIKTINTKKAGNLVVLKSVHGDEDVMIIKNNGNIIRINLEDISETSRNTKGVKNLKLKENEKIVTAAIIKSDKFLGEQIKEKTVEEKILNLTENVLTEDV